MTDSQPAVLGRDRPRPLDAGLALVLADLRDGRDLSVVGIGKWLLEPLASMLMYFLLVDVMLDRGQPAYLVFIMCALLPWRYMQGVVTSGMSLLPRYSNVILNRRIPLFVLPIVLVVTEGLNFIVGLILLPPLMIVHDVSATFALAWLPVLILLVIFLVSGPAFLAAVFGLYLPDYRSAVANVVRLGFLGSTGLVALQHMESDGLARAVRFNPASGVFDAFRGVVMDGRSPTAWQLGYPFAVGVGLLVLGLLVFRAVVPDIPKEL